MKHLNRIELVGTIKNVIIQQCNSTRRARLCVETEDLREELPVTVWENDDNKELKILSVGTNVHIVGRIRIKNQTTASRVEKTVRDIVANMVEIIDVQ